MFETTEKQDQALIYLIDSTTDYVGYGGGGGGGKSIIGCYWLMQMGFYAPNTKYFIGRDSLKDTRASVIFTWSKLAALIGFTQYKFTDNGIKFDNGSEIELLDLSFYPQKDPLFERLGSKEYTSGWIEEASQVHYMAFEVLKTRIGRWYNDELNIKAKILCTFNPKKNWIDSIFYRPYKNDCESENIKFVHALPTDNKYLPEDYLKRLHELKDEATKQRLLFGNFDYDDDPNALIDFKKIKAIWTNSHVVHGDKYIICDVARFGSDKAIITVWDGLRIIDYIIFDLSKTTEITNCINAMRSKYGVSLSNVLVDSDGVGGGVTDEVGCQNFNNGSKPFDSAYQNLKTECGYKLAEKISEIYFEKELSQENIEKIEQELGQLKTFDSDKDGKLRILPKEKIKENIGRSPDWLDIFIMRMYFELQVERPQMKWI